MKRGNKPLAAYVRHIPAPIGGPRRYLCGVTMQGNGDGRLCKRCAAIDRMADRYRRNVDSVSRLATFVALSPTGETVSGRWYPSGATIPVSVPGPLPVDLAEASSPVYVVTMDSQLVAWHSASGANEWTVPATGNRARMVREAIEIRERRIEAVMREAGCLPVPAQREGSDV